MRRTLGLAALGLAALLALVAAGCGGGTEISPTPETVVGTLAQPTDAAPADIPEGDAAAGKELFASSGCGGCHTLADAGTSGTVGPNLDEAKPSLEKAYTQITNGGGAMPPYKDQLSEQQIADIAAYVVQSTSG